jgi:hypothetical protein
MIESFEDHWRVFCIDRNLEPDNTLAHLSKRSGAVLNQFKQALVRNLDMFTNGGYVCREHWWCCIPPSLHPPPFRPHPDPSLAIADAAYAALTIVTRPPPSSAAPATSSAAAPPPTDFSYSTVTGGLVRSGPVLKQSWGSPAHPIPISSGEPTPTPQTFQPPTPIRPLDRLAGTPIGDMGIAMGKYSWATVTKKGCGNSTRRPPAAAAPPAVAPPARPNPTTTNGPRRRPPTPPPSTPTLAST